MAHREAKTTNYISANERNNKMKIYTDEEWRTGDPDDLAVAFETLGKVIPAAFVDLDEDKFREGIAETILRYGATNKKSGDIVVLIVFYSQDGVVTRSVITEQIDDLLKWIKGGLYPVAILTKKGYGFFPPIASLGVEEELHMIVQSTLRLKVSGAMEYEGDNSNPRDIRNVMRLLDQANDGPVN
jgi:hypothetical protein